LIGIFLSYFLWAALLNFVLLGPERERFGVSTFYAIPMAVELAWPISDMSSEFCKANSDDGVCKPLSSDTLMKHDLSGRYKDSSTWKQSPYVAKSALLYTSNYRCGRVPDTWAMSCSIAFEASGPNGEEFFLCNRRVNRCYFPELEGVQYPYG
jgi:hypothetical protein